MVLISRALIASLLVGLGIGLAVFFVRSSPLAQLADETRVGTTSDVPASDDSAPNGLGVDESAPGSNQSSVLVSTDEAPQWIASGLDSIPSPQLTPVPKSTGLLHDSPAPEISTGPEIATAPENSIGTETTSGRLSGTVIHAVGTPESESSVVNRTNAQDPSPASPTDLLKSVSELVGTIKESQAQTQRQLDQFKNGPPQAPPSANQDQPTIRRTDNSNTAETANSNSQGERVAPRITETPGEGDSNFSITFQGADIREVLEMLSQHAGVSIIALDNVRGTVSGTLEGVDTMTALDAILNSKGLVRRQEGQFIYVGTQQDFDTMRRAKDRMGMRLYRPNYVRAADLEALITPILTTGVGTVSVSAASEIGIGEDPTNAGGDAFAGQEALLVRDYEEVLNEIDEIVERVDLRPTQVTIEAMILSVKIDDSNKLGVNFELFKDQGTLRLISGKPPAALSAISPTDSGLKVGYLDVSTTVFVHALEQIGDTNVIATPRLMCLNKHPAQIKIGAELGYVNQTLTPEGTIVPEVQFLDVGTQLRLRPFISSDGLVRMEVHPEISKGSVRVEDGLTLPDKETTEVTTNIMVRDGHTVVIGGLLRDEVTQTASQVPLFGSLPVVGPLFRDNEEGIERQEILVLITPRISYDKDLSPEGDIGAAEFHQRQAVYTDKQIPFGRRYLGRKYLRLAQDAWRVGNNKRALRLVNLSIQFDPISRAAIRMRSDLWEGNPSTAYAHDPSTESQEQNPLDAEHAPNWLLDSLESGQMSHPIDPGRPGARHIISPNDRKE